MFQDLRIQLAFLPLKIDSLISCTCNLLKVILGGKWHMDEKFVRTAMLLGEAGLDRLKQAHVAVFGIGGVGGYTVEALARSGIGNLDLIDRDVVSISNINRQIIATTKTVGKYKTQVMKERVMEINPQAKVTVYNCFFLPETAVDFDFRKYDYVVDAVDTVTAKVELVLKAQEAEIPIISSMGAGNKLDPTQFEVADIYHTSVCPLARVMRRELKKRRVKKLKVLYSKEKVMVPLMHTSEEAEKRIPGSIAFVPSVAGLMIAGEVIKDLLSMSTH